VAPSAPKRPIPLVKKDAGDWDPLPLGDDVYMATEDEIRTSLNVSWKACLPPA